MRILALSAAIACALGSLLQAPPSSATPSPHATPARSPFQYMYLADLPEVAATEDGLATWRTPADLREFSATEVTGNGAPVIGVVQASALVQAFVQEEVFLALSAGMGVVVTGKPGDIRHETHVFGVGGQSDVVLYKMAADQTLEVWSVTAPAPGDTASDAWTQVVAEATRVLPEKLMLESDEPQAPTPAGPRKVWLVHEAGSDGRYASQRITVTRNTSLSGDYKELTVKAEAAAVPWRNGLTSDSVSFRPTGLGRELYIVNRYITTTSLTWPGKSDPKLKLIAHYPETTAETELDLTRKRTTTTSFGLGASPDVTKSLSDKKVDVTGKLPISVSFGMSQTTEETLGMKFKDYSVAFGAGSEGNRMHARWTVPLASPIASDWRHFRHGREDHSAAFVTPMMRQASVGGISTWAIAGDYEGQLTISSGTVIENRIYTVGKATRALGDCPALYDTKGQDPCAKGGTDLQPHAGLTIDLGSPFLTRAPTVLLQSYSGADRCLSQANASLPTLRFDRCDRREHRKDMQWYLDEASRYVNRGSGQCLATNESDGRVSALPCGGALTQQWDWQADRIHSRVGNGHSRIVVSGNGLTVGFGKHARPFVPVNITHPLLKPWSAYPDAPMAGDLIPGFDSFAKEVPESYLTLEPVSDNERWATVPLRAGLAPAR